MSAAAEVRVCDPAGGPPLGIVDGEGDARAIVWPGSGAVMRAMHRVRLGARAATVRLEHPGEAVYAVLDGDGRIEDCDSGERQAVVRGSMVHLDGATPHRFLAGDDGLDIVGGPAPADPALYPEGS